MRRGTSESNTVRYTKTFGLKENTAEISTVKTIHTGHLIQATLAERILKGKEEKGKGKQIAKGPYVKKS